MEKFNLMDLFVRKSSLGCKNCIGKLVVYGNITESVKSFIAYNLKQMDCVLTHIEEENGFLSVSCISENAISMEDIKKVLKYFTQINMTVSFYCRNNLESYVYYGESYKIKSYELDSLIALDLIHENEDLTVEELISLFNCKTIEELIDSRQVSGFYKEVYTMVDKIKFKLTNNK